MTYLVATKVKMGDYGMFNKQTFQAAAEHIQPLCMTGSAKTAKSCKTKYTSFKASYHQIQQWCSKSGINCPNDHFASLSASSNLLNHVISLVRRKGGTKDTASEQLYGFSIAYLVAPGTFDSTHVVEFIAGLPEGAKYAGKLVLAAPFAFHSLNGLRHLSWDMAKFVTVKGAYTTGYIVLAATAVLTVALTLIK